MQRAMRIIGILLLLNFTAFPLLFEKTAQSSESELYFTILHTNDEHSALIPHPIETRAKGGFARLATLVQEIRAEKNAFNEPVLTVSAGDIFSEYLYSWLILDGHAPEISLMTEIGYDAMTLGNHEFDYGVDILSKYLAMAPKDGRFTPPVVVSSNIKAPKDHPLHEIIKPTHLVTLENGIIVGFFGLFGKDASLLSFYTDPLSISDPFSAAKKAVAKLKAQGADVVIGITHSGVEEDIALAKKVGGIDLIVGGHTHTPLHEPVRQGDTLIVQAGYALEYLGLLEFAYNPSNSRLRLRNPETRQPFLIPIDHSVEDDPRIAAMVEKYTEKLNAMISRLTNGAFNNIADTVAYAPFPLYNIPPGEHRWQNRETPLGNYVADAYRRVVEEKTGEKVHFAGTVNGHIRENIYPGAVDFYDLNRMASLGFGPDGKPGLPLLSFYLTGSEVRSTVARQIFLSQALCSIYFIQFSGGRIQYDPNKAILLRVPFLNLPIPSFRSVVAIEYYDDETGQYIEIPPDDQTLYRVVMDYYMGLYMPLMNKRMPRFRVIPKDKDGNEVDIQSSIVYVEGEELKTWHALMAYTAAQPRNQDGIPQISDAYRSTDERMQVVQVPPWRPW